MKVSKDLLDILNSSNPVLPGNKHLKIEEEKEKGKKDLVLNVVGKFIFEPSFTEVVTWLHKVEILNVSPQQLKALYKIVNGRIALYNSHNPKNKLTEIQESLSFNKILPLDIIQLILAEVGDPSISRICKAFKEAEQGVFNRLAKQLLTSQNIFLSKYVKTVLTADSSLKGQLLVKTLHKDLKQRVIKFGSKFEAKVQEATKEKSHLVEKHSVMAERIAKKEKKVAEKKEKKEKKNENLPSNLRNIGFRI